MAALPLAYTVPASIGALSYLNARWNFVNDVKGLVNFIGSQVGGVLRERKDVVNNFYQFEAWAQKAPDRKFLVYGGQSWTYKEAYNKSLKYGTWLKNRFGVQKNEVVAMDFMNSDTFLWIWFGLWSIGAKPAFINYNLTGTPLIHSVKSSGARLLLIEEEEVWGTLDDDTITGLQASNFREEGGSLEIVPFTSSIFAEIENTIGKREPHSARDGQLLKDLAILIYTSGTTGLPKPAVVSWAKASSSPRMVARWLRLKPDDVLYTCMPLYHSSAAVLGVCNILFAGCTLSIGRKFHRKGFWDDCRASNATVIQYVGETCRYLMSLPPSAQDKQHNVRMAFGNGLRPDVWPVFKERFGIETIAEFYAATEGPSGLFNLSRNKFSEGAVGVNGFVTGKFFGSSSIVVETDYDASVPVRDKATGLCIPVKTGAPGELLFKLDEKDIEKGFQGYYKNKGATTKKILHDVQVKGDAWFSTGDIMRKDDNGRWFFCDRIGDTFRWKSENVSTAEVAEVLGQKTEFLEEANVYGVLVPGYDGRAGCVAGILAPDFQSKLQATGTVDERVLSEVAIHVLKNLPRYAVPVFLRVMKDESSMNRTGTNKQQKVHLRDEGIDPSVVEAKGDLMYWLAPGGQKYKRFTAGDFKSLQAGQAKL